MSDAPLADSRRTADYSHLKVSDVRAPTLVDTVADHLRQSILAGKLAPGERLYEAALAREFNISRGPIREALALLEGDGLVENEPRKGKFVRAIDARHIDEIYSLRRMIEPYAAEIVIEKFGPSVQIELENSVEMIKRASILGDGQEMARTDLAFHAKLYELSDHRPLQRVWKDVVSGSLQMLVSITSPTHEEDDSVRNHQAIIDSIVSLDTESTRDILVRHIEEGWARARVAEREFAAAAAATAQVVTAGK